MEYFDDTTYTPPSPPPSPDKDWVDPASVVRRYLNKIQQGCIQEEFKDLKEPGLYLLEAVIDSMKINTDESLQEEQVKATIKFPTSDFVHMEPSNVSGTEQTRKSTLGSTFSNLFENIFTGPKYQVSRDVEPEEVNTVDDNLSGTEPIEPESEQNNQSIININKGKAILIAMPGVEIIQKLQQFPVLFFVTINQTEDVKVEAGAVARVPESFRQAVLKASSPDVVLPLTAVTSDPYPLWTDDGINIGVVNLTLTISCFGCAVINSQQGPGPGTCYNKSEFLKSFVNYNPIDTVDSHVLSPGFRVWKVDSKTSEEILQTCKIAKKDGELKGRKCYWYKMAQESIPKDPDVESIQVENFQALVDSLWRKHIRYCREVLKGERNSLGSEDTN